MHVVTVTKAIVGALISLTTKEPTLVKSHINMMHMRMPSVHAQSSLNTESTPCQCIQGSRSFSHSSNINHQTVHSGEGNLNTINVEKPFVYTPTLFSTGEVIPEKKFFKMLLMSTKKVSISIQLLLYVLKNNPHWGGNSTSVFIMQV